MATYQKFHQYIEDLHHGVHDFANDQLVVLLTNTAPSVNSDSQRSDIAEIAYTNLSSRNITTVSSGQSAGQYKLTLLDLSISASGQVPTFRYVVICNSEAGNQEIIAFYDYEQAVNMDNGEDFNIDFSDTNGLFRVGP